VAVRQAAWEDRSVAVRTESRDVGASVGPSEPGRHRRRHRAATARLQWWHEVLLIAVGYAIYTVIRNVVPRHHDRAIQNAIDIERWERDLGILREHGINTWLAAHHSIAVVANYWYATAHFVVTIGVAIWILWKHPRYARPLRIAWYSTNLAALVGFYFYPLAPPRLMPGFVDTIVKFGIWGSWGKEGSADGASNPYAAMPSMHVGWSVWCTIVIVVLARRWWIKALAVAYPVVTILVISGTANHYFLDAVGGLVALGIGFSVARLITGAWPFTPENHPDPAEATTETGRSPA